MSRRTLVELGVRVVLVIVGLAALPHIFHDDVRYLWSRAHNMSLHHLPFRDFSWEYPPLTLVPSALAPLVSRALFRVLFPLVMAGCELASLNVLRRHLPRHAHAISVYWYAVGVPLSAIAWYRLDWPPVLFATLAMVAIARGGSGAGAIVAGFAAKLWPAVVAVRLAADRRWRQLALVVGGTAALVAAWYAWSPSGFRTFLEFRKGKGFQVEGVVGSVSMLLGTKAVVVSNTWVVDVGRRTWLDPLMTLGWGGIVAAVAALAMRRRHDPWRVIGGLVVLLLISSRLLSPQFLVWAVPFVAVAWAFGDRLSGWIFGLASAITLVVMWEYPALLHGSRSLAAALVVRNVLLLALAVRLLVGGLRPDELASVGAAVDVDALAVDVRTVV